MGKRKGSKLIPSEPIVPTGLMGLQELGRSPTYIGNDLAVKHVKYYEYPKNNIQRLAQDYLFGGNSELSPFLATLIALQKSRMDPALFGSLEGTYYQWKYEEVLKETHIWKSDDGRSDSIKQTKKAKIVQEDDSKCLAKESSKTDSTTDSEIDNKTDNKTPEASKEYIEGIKFRKDFMELGNSKMLLELKKEGEFQPWIYLKTVEMEGKKTIGMFAARTFPAANAIGFYISYPWYKWPEAFTEEPPETYDAELQYRGLLPQEDAGAYMWFFDDSGFRTACDPVNKPSNQKDEADNVTLGKRMLLGMGFHLTNESHEGNIEVDDNGCIKTIGRIEVDTQLVTSKIAVDTQE